MAVIEQTSLDWIINQLLINLFGDPLLVGLFILVFAIITCIANGFDLQTIFILLIPVIIGVITAGFLPSLLWSVIIFTISFLWIFVAWKIVGLMR